MPGTTTHHFADLEPAGPFSLGTVQLGMPYGVGAARAGLDADTVFDILDAAARCGVVWLDTAHAYGEAEARIGAWLARRGGNFRITTKLPALPEMDDADVEDFVGSSIEESRSRLGGAKIDICLTHRAKDILRAPVAEAMREFQENGLLGRFGASVYTVEETGQVLEVDGIGAMQVPLNAVASPIAEAGLVERAKARNVAVFARSVFLQGVLLLPPERIPPHLAALAPVVERLRALAAAEEIPLAGLLMDAVARIDSVYSLVIGADSPSQVEELAGYAHSQKRGIAMPDDLRMLMRGLSALVTDPRQWARAERETAGA